MTMSSNKKKLEVLQTEGDDEKCLTFVLNGEDHTLGNALRYMILKNPQVKFCGYAVPHPSEYKVNLRIQTYEVPAAEVFKKGLEDLQQLCGHVIATFENGVKHYKEARNQELPIKTENMEMNIG